MGTTTKSSTRSNRSVNIKSSTLWEIGISTSANACTIRGISGTGTGANASTSRFRSNGFCANAGFWGSSGTITGSSLWRSSGTCTSTSFRGSGGTRASAGLWGGGTGTGTGASASAGACRLGAKPRKYLVTFANLNIEVLTANEATDVDRVRKDESVFILVFLAWVSTASDKHKIPS